MTAGRAGRIAVLLSRIAAAIVGGFCATSAVVIALPAVLPGAKVAWVTGASLLGFAIWTGAVIWAFAARSAMRAWAGLAMVTGIAALVVVTAGVPPA